jgi:hypothetical protein
MHVIALYLQEQCPITNLIEVYMTFLYSYGDYNIALSLVKFAAENYGGLEDFWKPTNLLDKTGDFGKAAQDAFGITYYEYIQKWQK